MRGTSLELRAATRRFGALTAVCALDLELKPGEIHAIVGENGAGKSTALKLLAGHLAPSSGEVWVDGSKLVPATPQEAIRRGVGMVHQHFMLVERFTALENLILGREPVLTGGRLDLATARVLANKVAHETGLELELERLACDLAVGERQRLEILRVLYRGARAILLDEPTAVLTPLEVGELYQTLRRLAESGVTVAVVSHRLDEVGRYCDVVTVMRRGRLVLRQRLAPSSGRGGDHDPLRAKLTSAIMGGEPPAEAHPPPLEPDAKPRLRLTDVDLARPGERKALDRLTLEVRGGEILGIAGVEGNGQRELARLLAGLERPTGGRIELDGAPLRSTGTATQTGAAAVRAARARGLVVVHEDRQRDELLLEATVWDNLVLGDLGAVVERPAVERRLARFDIQPPDPARLVSELSGGNQQKLAMARALDRELAVLVLAQPTRGVDVGTARTIHHAISGAARRGSGVVLVSADLNELRSLCHRIVVLRRGHVVAELGPEASDETIGRAMLGTDVPPAVASQAGNASKSVPGLESEDGR
jgi:ABC-type uncharacterized transport system ATPase subunit